LPQWGEQDVTGKYSGQGCPTCSFSFNAIEQPVDIRPFWLFMLWRLQSHADLERLTDEVVPRSGFAVPAYPEQVHRADGAVKAIDHAAFCRAFFTILGFRDL